MPIPLPLKDRHSAVLLADWLELNALAEGQASLGDLNAALHAEGDSDTKVGSTLGAVQNEIDARITNATACYPFSNDGGSIEPKFSTAKMLRTTYVHCLLLSYFGPTNNALKTKGVFPERMFEVLSREAARVLIEGPAGETATAVRFGAPRAKGEFAPSFKTAITELCEQVGEGGGFNTYQDNHVTHRGDQGLDIVAWRTLDRRSGRLLLFGACAAGRDWDKKLTELADDFCQLWWQEPAYPPPLKVFFAAQVIPVKDWWEASKKAGLVIDRLRLAELVPTLPDTMPHGDAGAWSIAGAKLLQSIAGGALATDSW